MKHLLALSLMLSVAMPAWAEPPADIGESVEALRKKVGAPGVSIAIVEDGKTTLSRGWGVRKLGERAPVDAQTIFKSEEHTSELQSLMRISYAVFCLKKNKKRKDTEKR